MLLIGSRALFHHKHDAMRHAPMDYDYISTYDEFESFVKKEKPPVCYPIAGGHMVCKFNDKRIVEFDIAWEGTSSEDILKFESNNKIASLQTLRLLKESHKYKKSPHFHKTRHDLKILRPLITLSSEYKEILKKREDETYANTNKVNLNQTKKEFFDDSVEYLYDHDTIHAAIAIDDVPAYTMFAKDGKEVLSDMKKFKTLPRRIQLNAATEEASVLSIERCLAQNPNMNPYNVYNHALMRMCLGIVRGKFRTFVYNNFDDIVDNYQSNYYDRFLSALMAGKIKPFEKY